MALFPKMLFPTDFSEGANNALARALRMGDLTGTELIVQHVVDNYFERHPHWSTLFDVHELEKKLDFHVEHEMEKAVPADAREKIRIRRVLSKGRADEAIAELAENEMVDVILMGPARGAVTGKVIRRASRPVLSVPHESEEAAHGEKEGVARMMLATDFSEYSKKVVNYGFELKKRLGCDVDLVHVIDTPMWLGNMIDRPAHAPVPEKMIEWAQNQLKNLTPDEFTSDPTVQRFVTTGSPAASLVARIKTRNIDLAVLGAHGHGPVERFFAGTTTEKVLAQGLCPILTVRV
jgi:nucleotide-binding universal stress UspA family protein